MHPIFEAFLAQTAPGGQSPGGAFGMFLPLILIFVVFYFLMIRPQAKQQKQHQKFLGELKKGDDVVTNGGIIGKVHLVEDRAVQIDVGGGTKVRVVKAHIAGAWSETGPLPAKAEGKK